MTLDLTRSFPIADLRGELPRHPTAEYKRRDPREICGIVIHHTAGDRNIAQEAHGHIDRGWPGLGYHFWVEPDGDVYWANDIESIVFAQGGHGSPLWLAGPNKNFVSIVVRGNFDTWTSHDYPEALVAVRWLVRGLQVRLQLEPDLVFGHQEFKATACPGDLMELVNEIRDAAPWRTRPYWPSSMYALQRMLNQVRRPGRQELDVDGLWGPKTAAELGLLTGYRKLTPRAVAELIRRREELVSEGLL